jgi:hypothetical protein
MSEKNTTTNDPRQAINHIADVLRGLHPNINVGAAINAQPDIAQSLIHYISERFVDCTMPPSDLDHDSIFWEAIAAILSRIDVSSRNQVLDLFFLVQDPKTLYHTIAPLLRSLFFPSMLEPVLLQKIQSEDQRLCANAKEMDYFLFQSRSHFSMTPEGRAKFDAFAAAKGL